MKAEQKQQAKERAEKIVDAYFAGGLPPELEERILGWLVSRIGEGAVDDALLGKWLGLLDTGVKPGVETIRAFDRAMEELGFPDEVRARLSDGGKLAEIPVQTRGRKFRKQTIWRAAAVLIPAFIIAGVTWMWIEGASISTSGLTAEVTVSVTDGLQKQVTLSDNSEVWVNSDSKLEYMGDAKNKRIAKLEGEAYFKVERDEAKPFVVVTEHAEISVLGTEFNVTAREGAGITEVTLASGSVIVKTGHRKHMLEPGQMLAYNHTTGTAGITDVDGSVASWRSHMQGIHNRTLAEILAIVSDYYDYELSLECEFSDELYSVTFHALEPIESLLRPLSLSSGEFAYEITGKILNIRKTNSKQ